MIDFKNDILRTREFLLNTDGAFFIEREVITLMIKSSLDAINNKNSYCEWVDNGSYVFSDCRHQIPQDMGLFEDPKYCMFCQKEISLISKES